MSGRYRSGNHRGRGRSYGSRSRNVGLERALEHIEDAKRLSWELGGTDKDVKAYFFSLPPERLREILDAYEKQTDPQKRQYAEQTFDKWRTGQVQMSGTVAERLVKLLPPRMPLAAKYQLTESLWRHVGPSSRKALRVGLDASPEDAVARIREHIESVVINYKIPDNLERRFNWLADGDIQVKQSLLNHLRQLERDVVVGDARLRLPVMLEHMRSDEGRYTRRAAHILKVGKHELEVYVDKSASGVALGEPSAVKVSSGVSWAWVLWIAIPILLFFLLHHK